MRRRDLMVVFFCGCVGGDCSLIQVSLSASNKQAFPTTSFENGTCFNAVAGVGLTLQWEDQSIVQAQLEFQLLNITALPSFHQEFHVQFAASLDDVTIRSGRPGYLYGREVLFKGSSVSLLRAGSSQLCDESLRQPVLFGENTLSMCYLEVPRGVQDDCNLATAYVQKALTSLLQPINVAVGIYGDSDLSIDSDWLNLLTQAKNNTNKNCNFLSRVKDLCQIRNLLYLVDG
eukprot:m.67661 g.67661  ORF g.67661 m.67661 type:complete len:231 (+) comp13644_c1_seq2:878-1570(+)